MNYISIQNLKVFAHHGVFEEETKNGQNFFLSAKLYLDTSAASASDVLSDSVNYGDVCHSAVKFMQEKNFQLIEAAAEYTAKNILLSYPLIEKMELTLSKPYAPVGLPFENISVCITRSWHDVYLSIGSNIGDRQKQLDFAVAQLKENDMCQVKKVSDYIITKPYGGVEQEDFLNGAVSLKTLYTPDELLCFLHQIEALAGRERTIHWGPRTLDLDILFFDDLITESEHLILPHPDLHHRDFVLTPMKQIAPYKLHPLLQKRIMEITVS